MRRREFLIGSAAAAGSLAAPAIVRAQGAKLLKFIPQADLAVLDPVWTTAYVTRNHAAMVFDTLYGQDSSFRTSPQMVEGHVVENDGLQWTLTLRQGLKFHDDTPVLARDCVASIQRWGKRDSMGMLLIAACDEVSAPSDRQIVFKLKRPFPQLPDVLGKATNNLAAIMPERIAQTDPFKQVTEMVGSGPFRFKADERQPGALAVYEKFAGYVPCPTGTTDWMAGPKVVKVDRVEWQTIADSSTASAALQSSGVDWWELPIPDLLPILKQDANLKVEIQDPAGYIGIMRMNQLHPPFDNPAIRRAVLRAVPQADFMQAAVGEDTTMWKDGVGFFCPGTPMASSAGIPAPLSIDEARKAIAAAGYKGEKIVMLGATDLPILSAIAEVGRDLLVRLGFDVDYQATDWGTVVQRRTKRDGVDAGGWSVINNFTGGLDQLNPMTHTMLWSNGAAAAPGWPASAKLEEMRASWLSAPDEASRKKAAEAIQVQAFEDVPYVPLGQYLYATAYRKTISGVGKGFPVFWGIDKA